MVVDVLQRFPANCLFGERNQIAGCSLGNRSSNEHGAPQPSHHPTKSQIDA
jgi:hypothetical protein